MPTITRIARSLTDISWRPRDARRSRPFWRPRGREPSHHRDGQQVVGRRRELLLLSVSLEPPDFGLLRAHELQGVFKLSGFANASEKMSQPALATQRSRTPLSAKSLSTTRQQGCSIQTCSYRSPPQALHNS